MTEGIEVKMSMTGTGSLGRLLLNCKAIGKTASCQQPKDTTQDPTGWEQSVPLLIESLICTETPFLEY